MCKNVFICDKGFKKIQYKIESIIHPLVIHSVFNKDSINTVIDLFQDRCTVK